MDQLPKIVISKSADRDLEDMLKSVNDGFTSGRVKKAQLASWIISYFRHSVFSKKEIEKIQTEHFDQIAHLKSIIKQLEEANKSDAPVELDRLLHPLTANGGRGRRRPPTPTDEK